MNYSTTNSSGPRGGAFSAISCPAWWGICRFLRAIKTTPHLYPGVGWVGVYFDWCIMRLRKSQNIAGEEQLQSCFFFDRGKDMAINAHSTIFLNTDRQFNVAFKISDNKMVKHSIASNLITSRENALYSVYVASSNSQFQNQRATKGFILIRHKR